MNETANLTASMHETIYGPMTPTRLLTRAFSMYKERPRIVLGLVAIVAVVQLIAMGMMVAPLATARYGTGVSNSAQFIFPMIGTAWLAGLLLFVVVQVIHGAYFYAVTAWLGQREIPIGDACSLALGRIGSLISVAFQVALRTFGYMFFAGLCVALLLGVSVALVPGIVGDAHATVPPLMLLLRALPFVLLGMVALFVFLFWVVARYAISVPACLAEGLPAAAAIRRSITLSSQSKGRIYAMYAVLIGISIVNVSISAPLRLLGLHLGAATPTAMLLGAVASAASLFFGAWVISLAGIAVTLCYYDLRVRKESFGASNISIADVTSIASTDTEPASGPSYDI